MEHAEKLTLEVLVATVNNDLSLVKKMNLQSDAVIANQCGENAVQIEDADGYRVKFLSTATKGVGVNRNIALLASEGDILLFADDDVRYNDGYADAVIRAFRENGKADVILFGMVLTKNGEVFRTVKNKNRRLRFWQALRYGTYVVAIRRKAFLQHTLMFHQLFGGGCPYGSGEDSLFLADCFKKGLKVYTHSYVLGRNAKDTSSWFTGYDEKYFYDKGALFYALSPGWGQWMCRFIFWKNRRKLFTGEISFAKGVRLAKAGKKGYQANLPYARWRERGLTK